METNDESRQQLTLHEAMRTVLLQQPRHEASADVLSQEIANKNLYCGPRHGHHALAKQIRSRAVQYSAKHPEHEQLFEVHAGNRISLLTRQGDKERH